jgi:hypothetical protein
MWFKPKWLVLLLIALTIYVASYLMWSRCFAWGGDPFWSFFLLLAA